MHKVKTRGTLPIRRRGRKPRTWPQRLLVTDAVRLPDPLPAVARLQPGDGVLYRHYELPAAERLALGLRLARLCRRRGLLLLVAGDAQLARALDADGLHLPQRRIRRGVLGLVTAAAHDAGAIAQAAGAGCAAVLISPVFATVSHPGAAGLGPLRFAALAAAAGRRGLAVYALGGMNAAGLRRLRGVPELAGFAAIGALS
jgi:thiamine-phosphate pyrophosphorylase